jgi:hypothetical protein
MATLFLSYKLEDRELARQIQAELESLDHTIQVDADAVLVGSGWRDSLMRALMESDAVVALITDRSLQSPFVISEIGAARALSQTAKKMAVVPVVVGDMPIPQFIQDLYAIRVREIGPKDLRLLASDIDKAVRAHLTQIEDTGSSVPKLFISHRHKDEKIVNALVDVLRSAFVVNQVDIRCTSVRPYRLPVGERTADRLKRELRGAQAVIGILTPDTRESNYVLFELGGAWAQNILTCPMLARGASIADIPEPIRDITPLSLEDERDCQQFLDDLEDATTLKRQARVAGDVAERIRKLVEEAQRKWGPAEPTSR